MSASYRFVFALFGLLSTQLGAVENNLPSITASPAIVNEGETFSLMFSGTAPDACGLEVISTAVVDDTIQVKVQQGGQGGACAQLLTPFRQPIQVFSGGASARAGVYKVTVSLDVQGATAQAPTVLAFTLVPVRAIGKADIDPEAGNWNFEVGGPFQTSGSGVAFAIERQGRDVVVMPNFYDNKGLGRWYFAAAKQSGNALLAQLYDISGGQALFGAYKPPSSVLPIGNIALEFISPSRATVWITQASDSGLLSPLNVMPISIARFNFGIGPLDKGYEGKWLLVSDVPNGTDTQHLNFAAVANTGNTQRSFQSGEFRLNCDANSRMPQSLGQSCVLLRGPLQVAIFDRLALNQLKGQDATGKAVRLLRLDN
jgi:hypothetical protein